MFHLLRYPSADCIMQIDKVTGIRRGKRIMKKGKKLTIFTELYEIFLIPVHILKRKKGVLRMESEQIGKYVKKVLCMAVTNVDMVQLLEKYPPKKGAQLPDPTPEQIKETPAKSFDYTLPLIKSEEKRRLTDGKYLYCGG